MPVWLKVAAGVALGVVLIGLAGLQGASKRLGPARAGARHDLLQQ